MSEITESMINEFAEKNAEELNKLIVVELIKNSASLLSEIGDEIKWSQKAKVKLRNIQEYSETIEAQAKEIERKNKGLELAVKMLNAVNCFQGCNNGVIQISEDDFEQCQWCAELNMIKEALKESDG